MVAARSNATRNEMLAFRNPRCAPKIPGKRKMKRHSPEGSAAPHMPKQKIAGATDNAVLIQSVRRDTDPTM